MKLKKPRKTLKSIALFGGSFNPPHKGHFEIVKRVARRKTIDEVWILPVYRHAFGKKLMPFSQRLRLCRQMFGPLGSKVKVRDLERTLGGVSWTVRLVKSLVQKYPQNQFSWVMGHDAYVERKKWKNFKEIQKMVRLLVFPRGPKSFIPDISSTQIRKGWKKSL